MTAIEQGAAMTDAQAKQLHREVYVGHSAGYTHTVERKGKREIVRTHYRPGALRGAYCRGYVDARRGFPLNSGVESHSYHGGTWGYQMDRGYRSGYADGKETERRRAARDTPEPRGQRGVLPVAGRGRAAGG